MSVLNEKTTISQDFNSHAPRGARLVEWCLIGSIGKISTHTPREGRDLRLRDTKLSIHQISTHTPREGRDRGFSRGILLTMISTHTPREGRDW